MDIQRVQKAMEKDNLKAMAQLALNAATDLAPEQRARVLTIVGAEYVTTEDGEELSTYNLRNFLGICVASAHAEGYALEVDG